MSKFVIDDKFNFWGHGLVCLLQIARIPLIGITGDIVLIIVLCLHLMAKSVKRVEQGNNQE